MRTPDDRWAELVAAALAGELTPAESAEFEGLRRSDRARAEEFAALDEVAGRLRQGDLGWTTPRDTGDLFARIERSVDSGDPTAIGAVPETAVARRGRRWVAPLVGAACLVAGLVVGANGAGAFSAPAPSGPPGTLGAVERIEVRDDVGGVDVSAEVVAHTWGTEAYLEATGLDVGATYELVFVGEDGTEFTAGEVLGSDVPIVCRMNAAVLRGDAARMELRDTGDAVVAHAELPAV
ncbi:anti-sigma factor [Microbacterium sp. lyk4-40-TSB-66]|uniref:anti-sigma factor n=1 Tax=Microbacterium sp. lyk4-40-TSB-66 TaxID=3040294 RepID=UPI002550F39A|nr:anti-sigma factor [Microbacterium sp. lyk4-40-TSB-66]